MSIFVRCEHLLLCPSTLLVLAVIVVIMTMSMMMTMMAPLVITIKDPTDPSLSVSRLLVTQAYGNDQFMISSVMKSLLRSNGSRSGWKNLITL